MVRVIRALLIVVIISTLVVTLVDRLIFNQRSEQPAHSGAHGDTTALFLTLLLPLVALVIVSAAVVVAARLRAVRTGLIPQQAPQPTAIGGYVNADGTIAAGSGFSVSREAPGLFRIVSASISSSNAFPVLAATLWGSDGPPAFLTVEPKQSDTSDPTFLIRIRDASGAPLDAAFTFTIMKG